MVINWDGQGNRHTLLLALDRILEREEMIGHRQSRLVLRIGAVILLLFALRVPAALAHEGPARIELNTQQTSSGAELEIHGVNIAPEQPIMLSLIGSDAEFALGTVVGDIHGDFVVGVRLPAEALAGAYTVRAFGTNRVIVSAPLTLLGVAAEEQGAQRDQDEPLLAPMPHAQPASPVVAASPIVAAAPQESQIMLWPAIALMALAAAAGLAIVARKHASRAVK